MKIHSRTKIWVGHLQILEEFITSMNLILLNRPLTIVSKWDILILLKNQNSENFNLKITEIILSGKDQKNNYFNEKIIY